VYGIGRNRCTKTVGILMDDVVVAGKFVAEMFEDFFGALVDADDDPYRIADGVKGADDRATARHAEPITHVGIYVSGQMVDAPYTGAGVRVEQTPTTPGHRGVQKPSSAPRRSAERKGLRTAG
jgi:hypothetical protein